MKKKLFLILILPFIWIPAFIIGMGMLLGFWWDEFTYPDEPRPKEES